jgi:FAM192A/Fyv6, N-terminal domain
MKAEEAFSSLKKTVESKFITEAEAQKLEDVPPEPVEIVDTRPLYIRIAETQKVRDDYFDNLFKLSNRVHKIDEDEMVYYNKLEKDRIDKEKSIKQNEREELEKFKTAAQNLLQEYQPPVSVLDEPLQETKKRKDPQKDILASIVVKKKRRDVDKEREIAKSSLPVKVTPKNPLVSYASSSESE